MMQIEIIFHNEKLCLKSSNFGYHGVLRVNNLMNAVLQGSMETTGVL